MTTCDNGSICVPLSLWNFTGDFSHITGAAAYIVLFVILLQYWVPQRYSASALYFILAVYSLVKELWYDPKYESIPVQGQAWVDIVTYLAGGVIGVILVLLPPPGEAISYYFYE